MKNCCISEKYEGSLIRFRIKKNAACFLSGLKQLLPVIYEISNSCFHSINLYTRNQLFAFHLLNVIGQGELNISLCNLDLKALNSKIFSLCLNMQICVEMYLLFLLYTSLLLYVAEIFACYAILDHFINKNIHHGNLVEKKKIYIIVDFLLALGKTRVASEVLLRSVQWEERDAH